MGPVDMAGSMLKSLWGALWGAMWSQSDLAASHRTHVKQLQSVIDELTAICEDHEAEISRLKRDVSAKEEVRLAWLGEAKFLKKRVEELEGSWDKIRVIDQAHNGSTKYMSGMIDSAKYGD